jgi:hypothetical protein
MQEINELKNLVIQSLEGNGVLGQIRAQIRASVFKIIEMQEANTKKNAGFFWENPLCQKIYDNKEGKIALEIINEFLEFFKMDYTLSVFTHESNLKDTTGRDDLQKRLGVKGDNNKPLLFHIINALVHEGSPGKENQSSSSFTRDTEATKKSAQPKPAAAAGGGKNITTEYQDTDVSKKSFDNFGKNKRNVFPDFEEPQEEKPQQPDLSRKTGKLAPLSSLSPQDKYGSGKAQADLLTGDQGLKKPGGTDSSSKKPGANKGEYFPSPGDKFKSQQESDNEYDDEVFENVDEELVEDLEDEDPKNKDKKSMLTSSEDIIGASQSQGFDVSVDSLALEEYDYFETADRPR